MLGYANLISQEDGDQGDTAQRLGSWYLLSVFAGVLSHYSDPKIYIGLGHSHDMDLLSQDLPHGIYRRSPDKTKWYYNYKNLGRDQKSVLMLGMAAVGDQRRLFSAFMSQVSRFGFHQNTEDGVTGSKRIPDIMTPHEISAFIRGMGYWWFKPLLYVFDSFFFIDLILRKNQLWDYDNMLFCQMLYAQMKYPTLVGRLAWKLYLKTDYQDHIRFYHSYYNGCKEVLDAFNRAFEKISSGGAK